MVTTTMTGEVVRVIWKHGQRSIFRFAPENGKEITVLGHLPDPTIGQKLEITGCEKWSARFDEKQIELTAFRTIIPETVDGMRHYLAYIAKHIGPNIAMKLVDAYGVDAVRILRDDPLRAINIPGLTTARLRKIQTSLIANQELEQAMVDTTNLLGSFVSMITIRHAVERWGARTIQIIRGNPYKLQSLHGVSFRQADAVAIKLDRHKNNVRRTAHAVIEMLTRISASEGHTWVTQEELRYRTLDLIDLDVFDDKALTMLIRARRIVRHANGFALFPLHQAEKKIAEHLERILTTFSISSDSPKWTTTTQGVFDTIKKQLTLEQFDAFLKTILQPISILTGAPGTGKTYTLARILRFWVATGLDVVLCAPTGKAAKQMRVALEQSANSPRYTPPSTIHSLLMPIMLDGKFHFTRTAQNPLNANAYIVDETSMVDVCLMADLLSAIPNTSQVLFVGDHYQLPSVGPGAILRDLIAAGIPTSELRAIQRNAGAIVRGCHAIKDGKMPKTNARLTIAEGLNWRHVPVKDDPCQIKEILQAVVQKHFGHPDLVYSQVQIISSMNTRGELSCDSLNRMTKAIVNPIKPPGKLSFAVGDTVVRTKNGIVANRGKNPCPICVNGKQHGHRCATCFGTQTVKNTKPVYIVNGDVGTVVSITDEEIVVDFKFPDRRVAIPRDDNKLKLAYCLTCHKMQGSEAEIVLLPISKENMARPVVTREWLYTAISRAKTYIVTVGHLPAIHAPIGRIGNDKRRTALVHLLAQGVTQWQTPPIIA